MIRIEHVINSAKVFLRIFVKIVQHEEAREASAGLRPRPRAIGVVKKETFCAF